MLQPNNHPLRQRGPLDSDAPLNYRKVAGGIGFLAATIFDFLLRCRFDISKRFFYARPGGRLLALLAVPFFGTAFFCPVSRASVADITSF